MSLDVVFHAALVFSPKSRILRKASHNAPNKKPKSLLDVGGRKSPYSIGLNLEVSIIDLPQKSEIQKSLHLGLNNEYLNKIKLKRSNIKNIIVGDFLNYEFLSNSYDIITAVEVIEHIQDDQTFITKISTLLNKNGIGILTTPNGDFLKVNPKINPDHVRHYTREQIEKNLMRYFNDVSVFYFAKFDKNLLAGLKPWRITKPVQTIYSMFGNFLSYRNALKYNSSDCAYLIAIVKNPKKSLS